VWSESRKFFHGTKRRELKSCIKCEAAEHDFEKVDNLNSSKAIDKKEKLSVVCGIVDCYKNENGEYVMVGDLSPIGKLNQGELEKHL
jgi:tRNA-binding EMAP/Myf-like protein